MRSLNYLAAALLPVISSAYAGKGDDDGTVIVTQTRTVTVCPVVDWMTCDSGATVTSFIDRTGAPPTTTTTTSVSTTTADGRVTTITTDRDGNPTTITVTDKSSTSIKDGPSTSISTGHDGNGNPTTVTSIIDGSSTSIINGPSTSITTVTSVIDGPSTSITTSHDDNGNPTTVTSIIDVSSTSLTTVTSIIDGPSTSIINGPSTSLTTVTSIIDGPSTSITTSHDDNGNPTTVTSIVDVSSTSLTTVTSIVDGPSTTTGPIDGGVTTKYGNNTSSIETTSSSSTISSSTTSGCFNSTRTAAPFPFDDGFMNRCNRPGSRDQWCGGKTVSTNTEPEFRTGQVRRYRLEIGLGSVNADGMSSIPSFTINGKTPGDAIVANWGDEVEITVVNVMDPASGRVNATTIHWHGILQHGTNDQDGVPGVTECGIAPGSSRTYRWLASTYGTGWYHGHLLSQYGGGVRGPIIIHGPASSDYDLDMGAIMIDEKFSDSIFNIASYYAKARGTKAASNYLLNGKNLAWGNATNGEAARWIVKSGKKHLFRIINSSAQSGFVFHIDNHKMTVISADMVPISPYETEYLWIHSGQRYNVIVNADQPVAAYDVRAIVQKGCGTTIDNDGLGQSNGIMEYEGSCYATPAKVALNFTTVGICKDELLTNLKPVFTKDAGDVGLFSKNVQNMAGGTNVYASWPGQTSSINRWLFGGPTNFTGTANFTATQRISINYELPTLQLLPTVGTNDTGVYGNTVFYNGQNQWVYWIIQNQFITSHPMHLHGHDFAVLGQAYNKVFTTADIASLNFVNPMRRDTVLLYGTGTPAVDPSLRQPGYTVIGFKTDNPGAWLMHCHIIWHADGGMGIQIVERPDEITNYNSKPEFQSECSDMKAYQAGGSDRFKADYESGLKKRHLEEHKFHGYSHGHAVRHE